MLPPRGRTSARFAASLHQPQRSRLRERNQIDEAIHILRHALQFSPINHEIWNDLGILLQMQRRFDEAIAAHRKAVAGFQPAAQAIGWLNLGNALFKQGRLDEAIAALRQTALIEPDFAPGCANLANMLRAPGKFDEAAGGVRRCTEAASPIEQCAGCSWKHPARAARHRGSDCLISGSDRRRPEQCLGPLQSGHDTAAAQRRIPAGVARMRMALPARSSLLAGLHEARLGRQIESFEQNIAPLQRTGDRRYDPVHSIHSKGDGAGRESHPSNRAGIDRSDPERDDAIEAIGFNAEPREYDLRFPLLSLPAVFETTLESIPKVMNLRADPEKSQRWKERLGNSSLRVGLAWAGSPTHLNDRNRSISLSKKLALLTDVKDVQVRPVFKKGPGSAEVGAMPIRRLHVRAAKLRRHGGPDWRARSGDLSRYRRRSSREHDGQTDLECFSRFLCAGLEMDARYAPILPGIPTMKLFRQIKNQRLAKRRFSRWSGLLESFKISRQ